MKAIHKTLRSPFYLSSIKDLLYTSTMKVILFAFLASLSFGCAAEPVVSTQKQEAKQES